MEKSGIEWVDSVFNWCVIFLVDLADALGITYEEINVWLFVILWPVLTLALLALVLRQRRIIRELRSRWIR